MDVKKYEVTTSVAQHVARCSYCGMVASGMSAIDKARAHVEDTGHPVCYTPEEFYFVGRINQEHFTLGLAIAVLKLLDYWADSADVTDVAGVTGKSCSFPYDGGGSADLHPVEQFLNGWETDLTARDIYLWLHQIGAVVYVNDPPHPRIVIARVRSLLERFRKAEGHGGKTAYLAWSPDFGEEPEAGKTVVASDPQEAAETWAKQRDREGDYDRDCKDGTLVKVRDRDTGEETAWRIFVKFKSHYWVVKVGTWVV